MDAVMNFNDDCDRGWEDWVEALTRTVFDQANVKAERIYAEKMDADNIYLHVREVCADGKASIENEYCIHYVDDVESMIGLVFFYTLFQRESDGYLYLKDQGGYRVARTDGLCCCISLDDLIA